MGCVVSYEFLHACRHDSVVEVSVWAQEQRFLLRPLMHVPLDETLMSFNLDFWGCFRWTELFCGLTNQNDFWFHRLWDGTDRPPGLISLHNAFCIYDGLCISAHGTVICSWVKSQLMLTHKCRFWNHTYHHQMMSLVQKVSACEHLCQYKVS